VFRGRIAVKAGSDGYGFVEPDCGGGQVLFRDSSVTSGLRLRVGETVGYALADGSFALEAVAVTLLGFDRAVDEEYG
jgi:cold shock CspA family protein